MHPTGRPLDAEFQSNSSPNAFPQSGQTAFPQRGETALPPSDGTEMIIQDFNSFFEKLSGLDDVRWNDDSHSAAAGAGAVPGGPAASKAADINVSESKAAEPKAAAPQTPAAPAARPAATATAPAHLAPAAPGTKPAPHRAPAVPVAQAPRKPGLPLPFKLAVTALVLFAVGMGAGWMALSLPKTTDRSLLPENPLIPLDSATKAELASKPAPLANPWDAAKPAAPVAAAAVTATTTAAAKPETIAPLEPTAPKEPEMAAAATPNAVSPRTGKDEPDAFSQKELDAVPMAPAPQAVTVDLPKSDIFASAKASVEAAKKTAPKAKAAPQATPPGMAAAQNAAPSGTVQYAVQVGACSSSKCVENYRKLIQPLVGAHPVEVLQQTAGNGSAVQRVRIVPLSKEQAVSLKQSLEQADPRLKNAYVVKLADRS